MAMSVGLALAVLAIVCCTKMPQRHFTAKILNWIILGIIKNQSVIASQKVLTGFLQTSRNLFMCVVHGALYPSMSKCYQRQFSFMSYQCLRWKFYVVALFFNHKGAKNSILLRMFDLTNYWRSSSEFALKAPAVTVSPMKSHFISSRYSSVGILIAKAFKRKLVCPKKTLAKLEV